MRELRRTLRAIAVTLLVTAVAIPTLAYIVLSTPWAQRKLCSEASKALTELLGSPVDIGRVVIHPFNRITVCDVSVDDDFGHQALGVQRLTGAFELQHFLRTGRIVVDYVVVEGLNLRLEREAPGEPLNVQGIISRLKGTDGGPQTRIALGLNTVSILNSSMSYDVASAPEPQPGRFDPNHIRVDSLRLQATGRLAIPDSLNVKLQALSLHERSGLGIKKMTAGASLRDGTLTLTPIELRTCGSDLYIAISPLEVTTLSKLPRSGRASVWIKPQTLLNPSDLRYIVPALSEYNHDFNLEALVVADSGTVSLERLQIARADNYHKLLQAQGVMTLKGDSTVSSIDAELKKLRIILQQGDLAMLAAPLAHKPDAAKKLGSIGALDIDISGKYSIRTADGTGRGNAKAKILTGHGSIDATTDLKRDRSGQLGLSGEVDIHKVDAGHLAGLSGIGIVDGRITDIEGKFGHGTKELSGNVMLDRFDYGGYPYSDIEAFGFWNGHSADGALTLNDSICSISLHGSFDGIDTPEKHLMLAGYVDRLDLEPLKALGKYKSHRLSTRVNADLDWTNADDLSGHLRLNNFQWLDSLGKGLRVPRFELLADPHDRVPNINVTSDVLNGNISGYYSFLGMARSFSSILASVMPSLVPYDIEPYDPFLNNFDFDLSITDSPQIGLKEFFDLPIMLMAPVTVEGYVHDRSGDTNVTIDAPFLSKGDILIENTIAYVSADRNAGTASIFATTQYPTKKGLMVPVVTATACNDRIDTKIDWTMERQRPMNGRLDVSGALHRRADGALCGRVWFNPGEITFGEDLWRIQPSSVDYTPEGFKVHMFQMDSEAQHIAIDGDIAADPTATVTVKLTNISLIDIFETLEIPNVLISGRATGTCLASGLIQGPPLLRTDWLHIEGIGYNYCTLGNADVTANFDTDDQSIFIDAAIAQPNGCNSTIDGRIWPVKQELELLFNVNDVEVGFLQPFMDVFAKDISGLASGRARLYGNFKNIDLEGEVLGRDLTMRVDYTNVTYHTTDSVHISPGLIDIPRAVIYDPYGNEAYIQGQVRHRFFKDASFDFRVTDAKNILCYNTTSKQNPDWYGTVYGNGNVSIFGEPGSVTIDANMSTGPTSKFTFVLNDRVDAQEMSFITFRDRTVVRLTDSLLEMDATPQSVRDFRKRKVTDENSFESDFNLKLQVDINEQAEIVLEMDPMSGDNIRTKGNGSMALNYTSRDNDIRMYGKYILSSGNYKFTLQDIIIKDFKIMPGSSIAFHGDPYQAMLDIKAYFGVNANLSDLDESFLSDPELNRTSVPVHAILNVTGDMRQPDIAFDLDFPSLQSDIKRKVRSIISTEEMMNQQIIYLLALNRFYTPDYMASTTKGNELFSVASSTISGQLSNVLGKLSENWSIAPNLRSDRGDFSDVEVDVVLQSRLLNNRLLFNGNFGYRDKSLNSNQFVGDFDIEYLLNKRGSWRLKAYNRYNDQNYYLRTAATTQGVGIMFRHDFDNFFRSLFKGKDEKEGLKDEKDSLKDGKDIVKDEKGGVVPVKAEKELK